MNKQIYILFLITAILIAPLYGSAVKKTVRKYKLHPNAVIWMLFLAFTVTILGYTGFIYYTMNLVLDGLQLNILEFMELPLTGKGLIFFTLLLYSVGAGWHFLLYPLVRDFEQIRQEAQQRIESKQKKQIDSKKI